MSLPTTTLDLTDGEYMLPPGKVAMVVTYLEQLAPPSGDAPVAPQGVTLETWTDVDRDAYLDLFRAIGTPWLWFGRLVMAPETLAGLFSDPRHHVYVAKRDGVRVGLLELAEQDAGSVEVSYFGFVPGATRQGLGRWLMGQAQRMAWAFPGAKRLWVHTCTADQPEAVAFYMRNGFVPYARGIEIADDPRLSGVHPRSAGPASLPVI